MPSVGNKFVNKGKILEALDICQENNIFEFKDKLYKQKIGHATGQKQAPPVACSGAGIVERQFLNSPREIVFDQSNKIMSKPVDNPMFNSVEYLIAYWGRFIDDVFYLFRGNYAQAEWYFYKLNGLYPGQVTFTWDYGREGGIFLGGGTPPQ